MAWRGSVCRSFVSTARASVLRSTPRRVTPPPLAAPRRIVFSNPRTLGVLGCAQSMLPLNSGIRLTSYLTVNVRACCELSQGT
ncbi:uncharacterized protein LOC127261213 [Andrographis paniculata]|uniref:uncharacterized protein LOC127261213 n=1 Tax=Andrographis paniculata TaxID=175694 RepID=UPI0021E8F4E3|nr:uncharacterized protein LOC127261213 [Andrographis paniculata]